MTPEELARFQMRVETYLYAADAIDRGLDITWPWLWQPYARAGIEQVEAWLATF